MNQVYRFQEAGFDRLPAFLGAATASKQKLCGTGANTAADGECRPFSERHLQESELDAKMDTNMCVRGYLLDFTKAHY